MPFNSRIFNLNFSISVNEMLSKKTFTKKKEFHPGLLDIDKFSNPFFAQKAMWFFYNVNKIIPFV